MEKELREKVKKNFLKNEEHLSPYATKSVDGYRLSKQDEEDDLRPSFYHDIDRIIHSLSYTRYLDKTQVFSFNANDHISKRIVHVQLVSKIARTIARALSLNEDLTEAIALGHDIGHTPIGHVGEAILNKISQETLHEYFGHNFQSVRTYLTLEKNGKGCNLTVQVLDGIMCHNGEMLDAIYEPCPKTKEQFLEEYEKSYTDINVFKKVRPMTLEGCVVRISDLIGYLGRDIEDAIRIGLLKRSAIPTSITSVLGDNNRDIVNTIIQDIIENSFDKPYIKMSPEVFKAMTELKKFNYQNIYDKANSKEDKERLEEHFRFLFNTYLNDLETENKKSEIYNAFLNYKIEEYQQHTKKERIVIDFIAGMTDEYFMTCYEKRKKGSNR